MSNQAAGIVDFAGEGSASQGSGSGGPASDQIVVAYGFWIFLLSDIIMFSALFAAYAVLSGSTAGGPSARDLLDTRTAGIETLCLLFSSYACGLSTIFLARGQMQAFYTACAVTFALGAVFLGLELSEFANLIARDAGPSRSAFLSSFFALVGLHGLHVAAGLIWLAFSVAQMVVKGPRPFMRLRYHCFSLFWHALDIIWIALLTLVYLIGTR